MIILAAEKMKNSKNKQIIFCAVLVNYEYEIDSEAKPVLLHKSSFSTFPIYTSGITALKMSSTPRPPIHFQTHQSLAHRLILATLTGRAVHISQIRPSSHTVPGLAPHEVSFLRLLDAVTNGSSFEISYTGTSLLYRPGLITGSAPGTGAHGGVITHHVEADCARGVSYFLVPLCLLAPFSKAPFNIRFSGPGVVTSATAAGDMSVDSVRTAILPLYANFGISDHIELRILRRSNLGPDGKGGGGEVQLVLGHQVRLPKTVHLMNSGRVKKIRGVAYSTGVAASNNARMIEAARGVLNPMAGDTYIFSDVTSAPYVPSHEKSDPTAKVKTGVGFGLSLVAESSTGSLYSADLASPPSGGVPPEELGCRCAYHLLETISAGGSVSLVAAPTVLTLMAMGAEDVGRVVLGRDVLGSEQMVCLGRDLKVFGTSAWGIRESSSGHDGDLVVSVVGRGVGNVGRKIA